MKEEEIKKKWAKELIKKWTFRSDGAINYTQIGFDVERKANED